MEDFNLDDPLNEQLLRTEQPEPEEGAATHLEEAEEVFDADTVGAPETDLEEVFSGIDPEMAEEEFEEKVRVDERARIERSRLLKAASGFFRKGDYAKAESFYHQALVYGDEDGTIEEGLWASRTENYSSYKCLYELKTANAFAVARESVRSKILAEFSDAIREEREQYQEEAAPLIEKVRAGQNERHEAFVANRSYYLIRFGIVFSLLILFGIGCAVSSNFIYAGGAAGPVLTVLFAVLAMWRSP